MSGAPGLGRMFARAAATEPQRKRLKISPSQERGLYRICTFELLKDDSVWVSERIVVVFLKVQIIVWY